MFDFLCWKSEIYYFIGKLIFYTAATAASPRPTVLSFFSFFFAWRVCVCTCVYLCMCVSLGKAAVLKVTHHYKDYKDIWDNTACPTPFSNADAHLSKNIIKLNLTVMFFLNVSILPENANKMEVTSWHDTTRLVTCPIISKDHLSPCSYGKNITSASFISKRNSCTWSPSSKCTFVWWDKICNKNDHYDNENVFRMC